MSHEHCGWREEDGDGQVRTEDLHDLTVNLILRLGIDRDQRCLEEPDELRISVPDWRALAKPLTAEAGGLPSQGAVREEIERGIELSGPYPWG